MKAVSTIIASIMLVIITIGLVSTAYLYIIGVFGGQTSKTIKLAEADAHMIIFQNLGSDTIASDEIKVLVNGKEAEITNPQVIEAKESVILKFIPPELEMLAAKVNVIGPSNSLSYTTDIIPHKFEVTSGTVGLWHFEGDAEDETGVNPGVINGADCNVDGKFGRGCYFNGIDNYIEVPDHSSLNMTSDFTLMAWIKTPSIGADQGRIIIKRKDKAGPPFRGYGYDLYVETNRDNITLLIGDLNAHEVYEGEIKVDDDQWHHVVGQREGNIVRIYVDGILDKEWVTPVTGDLSIDQNLRIGRYRGAIGRWWNGMIDEVVIIDRALSHEEILDIMYG